MTKNILIAEDDEDIVGLLRLYLEKDGYKVISVDNGEDAFKILAKKQKKSLIIFSSVWHEIGRENYEKIFKEMKEFDAIVIRDMKSPIQGAEPIDAPTRTRIAKHVPKWQFEEFENKWGRIDNKENLYRFLLMYTYLDNWDEEMKEDYFSTPWSEIDWALEDEYDKDTRVKFLNVIESESKRMAKLVSDLLTLSRYDNNKNKLETVEIDLGDLTKKCLEKEK